VKHGAAPKRARNRRLSEVARLARELAEAREQQVATSEVLRVISSSPVELGPVFDAILVNAVRLCEAQFGNLLLYEKEAFRVVAMHGALPAWDALRRRDPIIRFSAVNPLGRIAATKKLQHITDFTMERAYINREPGPVAMVESAGARTVLVVPMLKQKELVGVLAIYRQEVRPFTDKQVALIRSFADQAAIAIENGRLVRELRQRTTDLNDALDQQTAASQVLEVVSRCPGDLGVVFDAISNSASEDCAVLRPILLIGGCTTLWSSQDRRLLWVELSNPDRSSALPT
jgi:GAF domain-containing protein